jgi:LDH2 family malate/lactate/ureidoglycolate dehydrogenase
VVRDVGACLVVDGGNSMGQIGARFAMTKVIERASVTGLAAVAVRGSNHCGAMAPYVMQALPHDMIGLATTNTLPVMAPWGSSECILGINPLALSVPAGQEMPIVYDAAWSGSARGKIQVYAQQGRQLPEGWALDSNGHPTTDPLAALDGLLLPIGGFKGTGMAFILGLLSTMLSGASYGTELGSLKAGPHPGEDGHFFMAIKVEAFEEVNRFKRRVDGVLQQLHASRLAPGFDRIYAPGEVEFLTEARYRQEGIPLTAATIQGIFRTAEHFGIDVRALGRDVQ